MMTKTLQRWLGTVREYPHLFTIANPKAGRLCDEINSAERAAGEKPTARETISGEILTVLEETGTLPWK